MRLIAPVVRPTIVAALITAIAGCNDPFAGCEPPRPRVLPDGSAPETVGRQTYRGHQPEVVWGSDGNQVRVIGFRPADDAPAIGNPTPGVMVRGAPAVVGDQTDVAPALEWRLTGCEYHLWLHDGVTSQEAIDYAGRY